MKKINIGLIGCGKWGKNILRDLKTLGCAVTAVCFSQTSYENAKIGNADHIVHSFDQLKNIDGIIIATVSNSHTNVINQVSHFQLPIFVEKPMTTDLASAERLASQMNDRLFVMHKWRYHAGIQLLADIATKKELGSVLGLKTSRINWGNHHKDVDMIWTCLPHDLSIAIEILGEIPKPQYANAIEWENETVELFGLLGKNPWFAVEISSARTQPSREIRLECEQGIAVLKDGYDEFIEIYHRKNWGLDPQKYTERRSFVLEMPLLSELREFVRYLQGGPKPKCSAEEGLNVVRTIIELRALAGVKNTGVLKNADRETTSQMVF